MRQLSAKVDEVSKITWPCILVGRSMQQGDSLLRVGTAVRIHVSGHQPLVH